LWRVAASNQADCRISGPLRPDDDLGMHTPHVPRIVRIFVAPLAVAGALVAAAPAMAIDYCVNTACGGVGAGDLQQALNLAGISPEPDRIFLGAGNYVAPNVSGFTYSKPGDPVELIGSGSGTFVTGPAGTGGHVLRVYGGPGTSVHDLTVKLPANVVGGTTGLETDAAVSRVRVWEADPSQANSRIGMYLNGGTADHMDLDLASLQNTTAIVLGDPSATVTHSTLAARVGVYSGYGGTIKTSTISGTTHGVVAARGTTTVASSFVSLGGANGPVVEAIAYPGTSTSVLVDNATLVGDPAKLVTGVEASNASGPAEKIHVGVRNTLMLDVTRALDASSAGTGLVDIAAAYSDYDAAKTAKNGNAQITQSNISHVGRAGVDEDYLAPVPGSPLIDAGDPATDQGEDVYGNPLVTDGDHDGVARRDIGAAELPGPLPGAAEAPADQPLVPPLDAGITPPPVDSQAPLVSSIRLTHSVFAVGRARTAVSARVARGTTLAYRLSEPARLTVRIVNARSGRSAGRLARNAKSGANLLRFSGRIGSRALRPGRYRALVTATDAAGNKSPTRAVRFRVVAG
jgi:hypothetical protein